MQAQSSKSLSAFDRQIQRIQTQLAKLAPMRPGTLTRQYRQPERQQGAYDQLSYTYQMRSHTEYVPKRQVVQVRQEIAAYQRYKKLTAQWIDLALQRSRLRMQLARLAASQSRPAQVGSRSNLRRSKPRKAQKTTFSHRPLH
jgi:Family of unknown function (DUF6788)